ncbi:glycoside hydrolase family 16 protein [Mammaliicoccus lentus]|uniref:glycoside hydrolase family 16 protein n=1 Tax=Mammaliicoccus lentus TaxID=42858 RepID=UPI002DB9A3C7|nr:glycoside hydrolase family 16 protein [Mammaliicoccus lentus]MEB8090989.1 glycoside hydrolase family 16 protein [Mammaliicoccus lentus]
MNMKLKQLFTYSIASIMLVSTVGISKDVANAESSVKEETYTELWKDDFNGTELNQSNWNYELGSIRGIEQQHYVNNKENVYQKDGNLVLKATDRPKTDQYSNPRDDSRIVKYNSGSIHTNGKKEFLYGKLEIRAKLPKGQGVFPAFWTLGNDFTLDGKIANNQGHGWPATGEIDITELIGKPSGEINGNNGVYQTLHYGVGTEDNGKYAGNGTEYKLANGIFNDGYHDFALDWDKESMKWLVDGKVVRTVNYADDPTAKAIFNKPQYMQLNLAMGGAWPGEVGDNLNNTEFDVDYVKYSRNSTQQAEADDYYASAPKIEGSENVVINQGEVPDLLKNIKTQTGNKVDYSINDAPMFQSSGGNTEVKLLVNGEANKEKIADLKPGKYSLYYSAYKNDASPADINTKIDRKSVTLEVR